MKHLLSIIIAFYSCLSTSTFAAEMCNITIVIEGIQTILQAPMHEDISWIGHELSRSEGPLALFFDEDLGIQSHNFLTGNEKISNLATAGSLNLIAEKVNCELVIRHQNQEIKLSASLNTPVSFIRTQIAKELNCSPENIALQVLLNDDDIVDDFYIRHCRETLSARKSD